MGRKLTAVGILAAAAVTLTAVAAAGPVAAKQRVAITLNAGADTFALTPLKRGALQGDSGPSTSCCWRERFVMRDGQAIDVNDPITNLSGKRGDLVVRFRIEWVEAGRGYTVGTSTWKVVRGTGEYARLTGGGRGAHVLRRDGVLSVRAEGFLGPR